MSYDPHRHDTYLDSVIEHVLKSVKTIALVGFSANESRPSFFVTKYLIERGYTLYPINPGLRAKNILVRRSMPR